MYANKFSAIIDILDKKRNSINMEIQKINGAITLKIKSIEKIKYYMGDYINDKFDSKNIILPSINNNLNNFNNKLYELINNELNQIKLLETNKDIKVSEANQLKAKIDALKICEDTRLKSVQVVIERTEQNKHDEFSINSLIRELYD